MLPHTPAPFPVNPTPERQKQQAPPLAGIHEEPVIPLTPAEEADLIPEEDPFEPPANEDPEPGEGP